MKKEKEVIHLKDGTTKTKEIKKYTPEDGFIEDEHFLMEETGVYHKGYQTRKTITTNDSRIIRAFIKTFCFLFLGIGLFLLIIHQWVFGVIFVLISVYVYKMENQKNDEREKELVKNSQYNKQNQQVVDDFKQEIKEEAKSTFSKVFSKENGKQFKKIFLLFYSIIDDSVTWGFYKLVTRFLYFRVTYFCRNPLLFIYQLSI